MTDTEKEPTIRRDASNHRLFVVTWRGKVWGPGTREEAEVKRAEWTAEQEAAAKRDREFADRLRPYTLAIERLKNKADRRLFSGRGEKEKGRGERIARELEGFAPPPYPPTQHAPTPHWGGSAFTLGPAIVSLEAVRTWQRKARAAANRWRQAARNRRQQPSATEEKRARSDALANKARALREQGYSVDKIAETINRSRRQTQRLLNARPRRGG